MRCLTWIFNNTSIFILFLFVFCLICNISTAYNSNQADVVFVFDTTGSMSGSIDSLKTNAINFADALAASGIDYRLGLTEFKDIQYNICGGDCGDSGDFAYKIYNGGNLVSSATTFDSWISSLSANGGADTPEAHLAALHHTVTDQHWRGSTVQKVIVLISDAPPHADGDCCNVEGDTFAGTKNILTSNLVTVFIAGDDSGGDGVPDGWATDLATSTGGKYYPLGYLTPILKDILDKISPQSGTLAINLVYDNAIQAGVSTPIHISVTSNSQPVPANIAIKINDQLVQTATGPDYIYQFTPPSAGSYNIEVDANYGKFSQKIPRTIEVIADISNALQLTDNLKSVAYGAIGTSEYMAISRLADAEIDAKQTAINSFCDFLGDQYAKVIFSSFPTMKTETSRLIDGMQKMILSSLEQYSKDLKKGVSPSIAYANWITEQEKSLENLLPGPQGIIGSIPQSKSHIDQESTDFATYIKLNSEKFSDRKDLAYLFGLEYDVIKDKVKAPLDQTFDIFNKISLKVKFPSEPELANTYDNSAIWGSLISDPINSFLAILELVLIGICIVLLVFPVAPAALVAYVGSLFALAGGSMDVIISSWKLILALGMAFTVPFVTNSIDIQHATSIADITQEVGGSTSNVPLYLHATNTTLGSTGRIDTNGLSYIITPDGRIIKPPGNSEDFIASKAGRYSAIAYQHDNDKLFSAIKSKTFLVSNPNVTLNISYTLQNTAATVNLTFRNLEPISAENCTSIFYIRNSSNGIVFNKMEYFSLDAGRSKNVSYTTNLNDRDIYTATAALSVALPDVLEEKEIAIPVGVESAESAAILDLEYLNEYSPHTNVKMNATVESYEPGLAFNISIPEFNYTKSVVVTGTKVINLTLPKLKPDDYTISVLAEKNGKVFDSRTISFYVQADGVGILAFNASSLVYKAETPTEINLSLKDLNLTKINAQVGVSVADPSGNQHDFSATNTSDGYQFNFMPTTNGTYMLEAHASKEGWRIDNNTFTVIVGQMSPLKMDVNVGNYVIANVTSDGLPAACNVTMYSSTGNTSDVTSNGLALFNATARFYLVADKMFFEPAYFSYIEPVANFTIDTSNPKPNQLITFNGSQSYDPDGEVVQYDWNFGDSNKMNTSNNLTTHAYSVPGNHIVNLTVIDNVGAKNSTMKSLYIINTPPNTPSIPSGLSSGYAFVPYSYSTSTTDPDSDPVKYTFDWGDGTTNDTGLVDSGTAASLNHTWSKAGTYSIKSMATDREGAISAWSSLLKVTIAANRRPNTPSKPTGSASGYAWVAYSYSTSATDPDGNQVKYSFDWGDGTNSSTSLVNSGVSGSISHIWSSAGTFQVRTYAIDSRGAYSATPSALTVTIAANNPPGVPSTISGPVSGKPGIAYGYSTLAIDPDGDQMIYTFDWGDGTTSVTGLSSGTCASASHQWSKAGTYLIKSMATDSKGATSGWSNALTVKMS